MSSNFNQVQYFYKATFGQNYIKDVVSQLQMIREEFDMYKHFFDEFHQKFHKVEEFITKHASAQKCIKIYADLIFSQFEYEFKQSGYRSTSLLFANIRNLKAHISFWLNYLVDHTFDMLYDIIHKLPHQIQPLSSKCQELFLRLHHEKLEKMMVHAESNFFPYNNHDHCPGCLALRGYHVEYSL